MIHHFVLLSELQNSRIISNYTHTKIGLTHLYKTETKVLEKQGSTKNLITSEPQIRNYVEFKNISENQIIVTVEHW